jgi:hypothetical protein
LVEALSKCGENVKAWTTTTWESVVKASSKPLHTPEPKVTGSSPVGDTSEVLAEQGLLSFFGKVVSADLAYLRRKAHKADARIAIIDLGPSVAKTLAAENGLLGGTDRERLLRSRFAKNLKGT